MPKEYFEAFPVIEYAFDGDDATKLVVDIVRRIRVRPDALVDGAIFYNYQVQDGDNPEIIADRYYGSSKYHWVVMLMNLVSDHVYDFPLGGSNFDRMIKDKYGSIERSKGVTKTITDTGTYSYSAVIPEWFSTEQTSVNNSQIESGFVPAGNTTAIILETAVNVSPYSNIDVGDEIQIFVPESWYDYSSNNAPKLSYTQRSKVVGKSIRTNASFADKRRHYLNTNMNSNTYPEFTWTTGIDGDVITIRTGIHHFEMAEYDVNGTLIRDNIEITLNQYVNNSIGTTPTNTKTIVSNHDYEIENNETKRTISLLKRELLGEFVTEFTRIINTRT